MKNEKKAIEKLLAEMDNLFYDCKNSNDVNVNTMSLESYECFFSKYCEIYAEIIRIIDVANPKVKKYARKEFNNLTEKMRELLVANLNRILYAHNNLHICAKELEEIPEAVDKVEEMFSAEVHKAINYFGPDFFKAKLRNNGYSLHTRDLPETVSDMLDCEKRWQWVTHEIIMGYPKALYLELYRNALPRIIKEYIEEAEKNLYFC